MKLVCPNANGECKDADETAALESRGRIRAFASLIATQVHNEKHALHSGLSETNDSDPWKLTRPGEWDGLPHSVSSGTGTGTVGSNYFQLPPFEG